MNQKKLFAGLILFLWTIGLVAGIQVETTGSSVVTTQSFLAEGNLTGISDSKVNVSFQYREEGTSSWNLTTNKTLNTTREFNITVGGLKSATTYEFRAKGWNSTSSDTGSIKKRNTTILKTLKGGNSGFSTKDFSIETLKVDDGVGTDFLVFHGNISGLDSLDHPVEFNFSYRKEGSSSWNTVEGEERTSDGTFEGKVENLDPRTTYEFRATSTDKKASVKDKNTTLLKTLKGGESSSFGTKDFSLRTLSVDDGVGTDFLVFHGNVSGLETLDHPIEFNFSYKRQGGSSWKTVEAEENTSNGEFSRRVEGLDPSTTYIYRSESVDKKASEKKKNTTELKILKGGSVCFNTSAGGSCTISLNLFWTDNSETENGFRIESNFTGSWEVVDRISANSESYTHSSSSLSYGSYICYRVFSYNRFGASKPARSCIDL